MSAEMEALRALVYAIPHHLCCEDFHHGKAERHELAEPCTPYNRYQDALTRARTILSRGTK